MGVKNRTKSHNMCINNIPFHGNRAISRKRNGFCIEFPIYFLFLRLTNIQQTMKKEISDRLSALRNTMRQQGLSALIIPSTDPHLSEYVPEHWKIREWISGFNGSAGTAVVTLHRAALWTDSRYFLQAAQQLEGTGFALMKDRLSETPSIPEWLGQELAFGETIGINGWVSSISETEALRKTLEFYHLKLYTSFDEFNRLWNNRPSLPVSPIDMQPMAFAGRSCKEKLSQLRKQVSASGAEGILISALDEIAWILNIRGHDVHCNPVAVSYLLITPKEAVFFIQPEKLTEKIKSYLIDESVGIRSYQEIQCALRTYSYPSLMMDPQCTNYAVLEAVNPATRIVYAPSPVSIMKAVKNECEITGFHQAMQRDGVAMVKFLKWLEEAVPAGKETEMSIDRQLYTFRAEQPLFKGISFDTIAGYKEHGAIVHYEATPETDKPLKTEGLLLLDSGAQYQDGTTDITRTIALGPLTDEEKRDYTIVLKAHIGLSRAKFPQGTCGTQLDALAHAELWKEGLNYMHGTGHGVGAYLNVHEGPHQIRMNHVPTPLQPGMTVTDEPGVYKTDRYGIRIENTLLIVPFRETEFGAFYQFEPLTLCPIDTSPLVPEMLNKDEKAWLNDYHRTVYNRLAPLLDEAHRTWLQEKTKEIL